MRIWGGIFGRAWCDFSCILEILGKTAEIPDFGVLRFCSICSDLNRFGLI